MNISRMTDEELRTFVLALCDGRIFTMHHVPSPELVPMVFMPIALGAFADATPEEVEQVGTVYEYLDKAGPRAVNGMPMFTSLRMIHVDDWARAKAAYDMEMARRKDIPV